MIKIIEDPEAERNLIESSVKKYGSTPDHNFDWFLYCVEGAKPRGFYREDGSCILAFYSPDSNEWALFSDPIAPPNAHGEIIKETVDFIFNQNNVSKISFLDVREPILKFIEFSSLGDCEVDYELVWPVLNMDKFDPDLPGGHFKTIRNAKNKFYREHKVEIVEARFVDKNLLYGLVDRWNKNRIKADIQELFPNRYRRIIDGGFRGMASARAMMIDGALVGFNAGWETPNTPGDYSAAVGIHDFSAKDLGLALLIEDLEWIKKAGYRTCDLEGSEPEALKFKMQFLPERTYKTYTFYLVKHSMFDRHNKN